MNNNENPYGSSRRSAGPYRPKTLEEIEKSAVVVRSVQEDPFVQENGAESSLDSEMAGEMYFDAGTNKDSLGRNGKKNKKKKSKKEKRAEKVKRENSDPRHLKNDEPPAFADGESGKGKSNLALSFQKFFYPFTCFVRRHKVISIICLTLFVIILSFVLTINHLLNKIDYVSQDDYFSEVGSGADKSNENADEEESEKELKYITLSTGEIIDVSKLTRNADGTYNLPDGRRFNKDRTIWNTDGSMVFYDGSYMLPDGTAVLTDGTTFYPDELLVFQDGTFYKKTKISVDTEGYVSFFNGIVAHLTNFICAKDGTCTAKVSAISNLKYTVSGSWNAFDKDRGTAEQIINVTGDKSKKTDDSKAKEEKDEDDIIREALANADGLNDDEIAENYNNNQIFYSNDIKNILLMGIDEGSKRYPYGRSDSMIVISVNTKTKAVKMVSFSRAVYAAIAGYDNTRLNHAHGYGGAPLAIDTIERNYKIKIDNYVETGFETFKQIIDVLGGVEITLNGAEANALKSKIKKAGLEYKGKGTYNLNGSLALEYVRLRKIDTDRERTARQRKVLMSIASKFKSQNAFQLTNLANKILPLIRTDMSKSEIISQLTTVGSYLNGNVEQYVIPHKSSALTLIDEYEVLIVDWKDEVKYVHKVFYDGVATEYYAK